MGKALGTIEVIGLTTAIFVADEMVKSADIELQDFEITKGYGYVTIKVVGDVGAVKASVNTGVALARNSGKLIAYNVIARPSSSVANFFCEQDIKGFDNSIRTDENIDIKENNSKKLYKITEKENKDKHKNTDTEKLNDAKHSDIDDKKSNDLAINKIKKDVVIARKEEIGTNSDSMQLDSNIAKDIKTVSSSSNEIKKKTSTRSRKGK